MGKSEKEMGRCWKVIVRRIHCDGETLKGLLGSAKGR